MLEIERRSAVWRSEEYRRLLEQFAGGDVGQSTAQPEGGPPVGSLSQFAPATPSGPTPQRQQVLPNLVARQDDDDREHHQRSVITAVCMYSDSIISEILPIQQHIGTPRVGTARESAPQQSQTGK